MLTISDPYRGFTLNGIDAHLSMGLVLTPPEFAAEAMRTKQQPHFDTWALWAHMPDSVVRLLESKLVPRGGGHGLIESEQGVVYPIVNLQAAGLQVRILLSLADVSTQRWFRAVCGEGALTVAFEVQETQQLAIVSVPCHKRSAQQVDNIIGRCTSLQADEAVVDAAHMVRALCNRSALPSLVSGLKTDEVRMICMLGHELDATETVTNSPARVLN